MSLSHFWKVCSQAPKIQVFVGLALNRIISIRKSSYSITISSQVPVFHFCCLESPVGKNNVSALPKSKGLVLFDFLLPFARFAWAKHHIEKFDDKGAASTCKPAEQQNKPEAPVWLPTFWACTENLVWANDLLKGDQDTANMIWSMSHQKKTSMKKQKIQRP